MDRLDAPPVELTRSLADIAWLNRLGARRAIVRHLAPFLERRTPGRPLRILDVGTGAADIPMALVEWARRRGHDVRVVALEMHPTILGYAARAVEGTPEVRLVGGDALQAPIRPRSIDVALCSLML